LSTFFTKTFSVDQDTWDKLQKLSASEHRNPSEEVRFLIDREWQRRHPEEGTAVTAETLTEHEQVEQGVCS